jgi:hypothetical protein
MRRALYAGVGQGAGEVVVKDEHVDELRLSWWTLKRVSRPGRLAGWS